MSERIPSIEEQDHDYKKWILDQEFSNIDDDKVKYTIIEELKILSQMDVKEYTLWQKYNELKIKYPIVDNTNLFFQGDNTNYYPKLNELKNNIWIPESPEDYLKLEPELILANEPSLVKTWNTLRVFIHTQRNNPNIGRNMFFIVKDKITGKFLGLVCITGDFLDLTVRDKYIGWTREQRTDGGRLKYTCIGSTIVPTQPLGFNFVGGKLLALLAISNVIEEQYKKKYGNIIAGITTTSLYSSFSQYQNLSYWNKRGHSAGSIRFEPSKKTVQLIKDWMRYKHPRKYWEWWVATRKKGLEKGSMPLKRDYKQRALSFTYSQMKIPKEYISTSHQRGIYFCRLYENTNEFLREEIEENKLIKRFDNSVEALTDIWKEKYAKKRITKMLKEGKYNKNTLFYNDMIGKSWEECKEMYLREVGR
jgi:hypothetical protein